MALTISDIIEQYLLQTLEESNSANISRNELAVHFSCAPSQINYVLATRFTLERGFVVDSRRGGGGYITVVKTVQTPETDTLTQVLNQTDPKYFNYGKMCHLTDRLESEGIITPREGKIIKAALSNKVLLLEPPHRDAVRTEIFRNMLKEILKEMDANAM